MTLITDPVTETFGYVAFNKETDTVVVAYRGTHNTQNWVEDADSVLVDYPAAPHGAKVHEGFYLDYVALSSQTIEAVRKHITLNPGASLTVTGHSLGAALATLAALDIKEKLKPTN